MKVKIGTEIVDSNDQPIMLIFDHDEMRTKVIDNLNKMTPREGIRKYIEFNPAKYDQDFVREFMKIDG